MRLDTEQNRIRYAQIGVPAAVIGVIASALSAAPAAAADPVTTGAEFHPTGTPRVIPASTPPANYTVQSGDTIASIASKFGLATTDVLAWNDLGWRSVIYPGQSLTLTAAAAPAAPTAAAPATPAASTHTVVAGDTIFAIADKNGTSVDAVLAANGLSRGSVIYPGQELKVAGTAAPAAAPPTPAPTPTPAPAPAPAAAPAAASGTTHTVAAGETLFAIAQKYNTSVDALYSANGLGASSIIYPGQSITVSAPAPAPAPASTPSTSPQKTTLNAAQAENAALIIRIGREIGVSDRGIALALATSMVESWLRNLDWGDRDSLGLFQQRPSTGWGTADQIRDRGHSIRAFFGGASDPNGTTTRGLLDIPGWESMSFTDAAQAVQISGYPERYGAWEAQAYEWIALYG